MTLPSPTLDDRTFQDIVDEAKRLIPRYCPEWTDHNLSDPGVALIELFAWMTELTLYRLNQVPDHLYIKFLELVGIETYSAMPARVDLLFRMASPVREPVHIPAGTQVSTDAQAVDPLIFATDGELTVVPPEVSACLTRSADGVYQDVWDELRLATGDIVCFPTVSPGDALYVGFSRALSGNLIAIQVSASASGAGIDPERPPIEWQAWDGTDWATSRVIEDATQGFNNSGTVTLLVPSRHEALPVANTRAWWLRCRLMQTQEGQAGYDTSPRIRDVSVDGLGGSVSAQHSETVPPEMLGVSDGTPAQAYSVKRQPVLARRADEHVRLLFPRRLGEEPHWENWDEVADFSECGPDDRVYVWQGSTGEIRFGPRVRRADGTEEQHGAVPQLDAQVWVTGYRYGGGRRGNVGPGTLVSPRSSISSIDSVTNLDAARGGVDAETVENAKLRGPLTLRGGNRAVTAADFERHTLGASGDVARAHCRPPERPSDPVSVLVVPRIDIQPEELELEHLRLPRDVATTIARYLDERRLLTTRVVVDGPEYRGVSVAARVRAHANLRPESIVAATQSALYRYVNPLVGGPTGVGWPFGRSLNVGDLFNLLSAVPGVTGVEEVFLFGADVARPRGTRRVNDSPLGNVAQLEPSALFLSCDHRVVVVQ